MDLVDIARYLGALILVLALVGLAALAARRYGLSGMIGGTTSRRLAIVETLLIDPRHRLFLLRRDGCEHLVLVGPAGTSVLESRIAAREAMSAADALRDGTA